MRKFLVLALAAVAGMAVGAAAADIKTSEGDGRTAVSEKIIHVPGFRIGTAEDSEALTGVSVILAPEGGAVGGVDVRGLAPGTRETDLLRPEKTVGIVHAVVLSGGSAFGLEASCGVMRELSKAGIGFPAGPARVPIVCGAVIFDLGIGRSDVFPDVAMGSRAAACASSSVKTGNYGAGAGATVGKLMGSKRAVKTGAGYAELAGPNGLIVGAYVVVNACGEVYRDGQTIAGIRADDGRSFISSPEFIAAGAGQAAPDGTNTTISCVITNARLTKAQCSAVAGMSHDGYARAIRPVHMTMDGDTIFVMAGGQVETKVDTVGWLAEEAVRLAIYDAVESAESAGGLPAYRDLR